MNALERYIEALSSPEDPLLGELERETNLRTINPQMLSGHISGKFMKMLVRMLRPRRILEIGTLTGYTALSMAAGLDGEGVLDTCEKNDELEELIRSFFARSPYGGRIRLHIGSALETVPALGERYDLVFIDGDKREYCAYYRMLMDGGYVGSGSFILADNILWYGKVAEPVARGDRQTQEIDDFNRMVRSDGRVENVVLPIRDGINLIRVK